MRRSLPAVALALAVVVAACGGAGGTAVAEQVVETVDPAAALEIVEAAPEGLVILDVRTPEEFAEARLPGAINVDFYAPDFRDRLDALDKDVPYVLYCRSGSRSATVRELMRELGFREVHEIGGGILRWTAEGLPLGS